MIGVKLTGKMSKWTSPKDVILKVDHVGAWDETTQQHDCVLPVAWYLQGIPAGLAYAVTFAVRC